MSVYNELFTFIGKNELIWTNLNNYMGSDYNQPLDYYWTPYGYVIPSTSHAENLLDFLRVWKLGADPGVYQDTLPCLNKGVAVATLLDRRGVRWLQMDTIVPEGTNMVYLHSKPIHYSGNGYLVGALTNQEAAQGMTLISETSTWFDLINFMNTRYAFNINFERDIHRVSFEQAKQRHTTDLPTVPNVYIPVDKAYLDVSICKIP